jgi:7-cyano-7-deazaguanine synthase
VRNPIAICVVSGGLDSVTLAYYMKSLGYQPHLVSFNYGQRHVRELACAQLAAQRLDGRWDAINLSAVGAHLSSALTDLTQDVPEGHYAADNMKATVVPNRNAIMLSIAWGLAVARGADAVATGIHAGDHAIYPDCRPEFASAFNETMRLATEGFRSDDLELVTPFGLIGKGDIVSIGARLGVPFAETWSCYKGGDVHCGKCGTCVERMEAFVLAGVPDPTVYE